MDEFIKSEEAQETVLLEGHIPVEEQQSPSIVVTDFDGSNNDMDRVKSRDISGVEEQESLSLLENTSLVSQKLKLFLHPESPMKWLCSLSFT